MDTTDSIEVKPDGQICWIWPFAIPRRIAARLDRLTGGLLGWQTRSARWLLCGLACGSIPVLIAFFTRWPCDQWLTMLVGTPMVLAAVRHESRFQAMALLCVIFAAHSATVIGLTVTAPKETAELIGFGEKYWQESRDWIVSGDNPEYELSSWVPAHLIALFGVPVASYVSLGSVLFVNGLHQVDMMNVYVGNLIRNSQNPLIALGLGWHPWSMMRGIGFLLLGSEAIRFSLERMLQSPAAKRRLQVVAVGVGFLVLDALLKLTIMESVRGVLFDNLIQA